MRKPNQGDWISDALGGLGPGQTAVCRDLIWNWEQGQVHTGAYLEFPSRSQENELLTAASLGHLILLAHTACV